MGPASGRRLRVTLATRIFLPEPSAASFRLAALVRALADDGARVDVLTTSPGPGVEQAGAAAGAGPAGAARAGTVRAGEPPTDALPARVRRAPVLRDTSGYVRGYLPYLSFDVPLVWRLLRTRRPDVVVVEPPPTTGAVVRAICALRAIPYVYYAADVWSDASASTGAPGVVVAALRHVERFALRGAAAVLSVNDGVSDRVRELGARQVVSVGNGVDTSIFHPADDRLQHECVSAASEDDLQIPNRAADERAGIASAGALGLPDRPFLLYAGTASEWQGAEIFARAMPQVLRELPDARLVYLGQGSSWPALRALAAELPAGAVQLYDPVNAATSAIWQRAARAAVVSLKPGIGYDFAMPTKMFAALACGTPVVFAGPGPAAELVRAQSLGAATDYDVERVADAMVAALRAPPAEAERERLAAWVAEHRSLAAVGRRGAEAVAVAAAMW